MNDRDLTPQEEADIALWLSTRDTNPALALLIEAMLRERYDDYRRYGVPGPKRIYELGLL